VPPSQSVVDRLQTLLLVLRGHLANGLDVSKCKFCEACKARDGKETALPKLEAAERSKRCFVYEERRVQVIAFHDSY
jgi:hypothetical protein